VNHMVTVRRDLVERHPELIPELLRLFRDARDAVLPSPDVRKILPFGRAALDPAVALALRYAAEQGLLPQPMTLADVWQGSPPGIT